jgi:hypothetical protein
MNYDEAIEYLKTSKDVNDWNNKMIRVQNSLTQVEVARINQSGLIVEVLGVDRHQ